MTVSDHVAVSPLSTWLSFSKAMRWPLVIVWFLVFVCSAAAQDGPAERTDVKKGFLVEVPVPLSASGAAELISRLEGFNELAADGIRTTVVLQYGEEGSNVNQPRGDETELEDGLRVARAITGKKLRKLRIVSWLRTPVNGHSTLPIIASDMLIVGADGQLRDASAGEDSTDETITLNYQSIAKRRGLFPAPVIDAMVDADLELSRVTKVDGQQSFFAGDELKKLRSQGEVLSEDVISTAGVPLTLTASQLTQSRIAANSANSDDQLLSLLDLAELKRGDDARIAGQPKGVLVDITGSISAGRVKRWRSNLNKAVTKQQVNTFVVSIDSTGGSLTNSLTLAADFASPQPPVQKVVGWVRGDARGDAALVAISCRPLLMKPTARIGGSGGENLSGFDQRIRAEELIVIAKSTNRSTALIRGLLDPTIKVFRYDNRKTGQVRYATQQDVDAELEDADAAKGADLWRRGEQIELSGGVTAERAIELGLADGLAGSLDEAARKVGLPGSPPELTDNALVRLVENLGRSTGFSFLLFFIAFSALSTEINAPGLGVPGFVGILCLALFVWMKFLAGTAEWFEVIALVLGIGFIALEIFVLPGFGIFGIGGFILTMIGVVLMSQTFVLPQNSFQVAQFAKGVWLGIVGIGGLFGGFLVIRYFFPHVPMLQGLVMETGDGAKIEEAEKLGDYQYLRGQEGVAATPLRPSGKVKFGDEIIQVVSDGSMIDAGDSVRVCDVHATRVVVELVE